jgi:hypothetical protein
MTLVAAVLTTHSDNSHSKLRRDKACLSCNPRLVLLVLYPACTFTPSFATLKCVTSKERIRLYLVASDGTVSNIYKPPEQTRKKTVLSPRHYMST